MDQRVFAVRHQKLPALTKVFVVEDVEHGFRAELFYFIPPVLATSTLLMEVFEATSNDAVLEQVKAWIRDHFGGTATFEELPE